MSSNAMFFNALRRLNNWSASASGSFRFASTTFSDWEALAARELKGRPVESLTHSSPEGLTRKPLYTSEDIDLEALQHEQVPGAYPYTRGPYATMYTNRPWTIRQYAGFSTAEESNAFYKASRAQGVSGLSIAFDLPTHRGYDSDHELAGGDVGLTGVAIDTVEDVKILFNGIPLDQVSVSMTMNGAVLPIMAMFIVAAREQGVPHSKLRGTMQNDPLKEFMVRNTYIYPPDASMHIVSDIFKFCSRAMPKFHPISISGYHMQEAGASPAVELAFTLADGLEYLRLAKRSGLAVDEVAPYLSFFFAIGMDFFSEVAKLRAARRMWARLVRETFPEAENAKSAILRTHCQTSGFSLSAQDPTNNVVRTTVEALAAVLGGTQSLHTNSFDEALALPSDHSARIARNTQLILQEEAGVTSVIDPFGGSYMMEALTNDMERVAMQLVRDVEAMGGMTAAIKAGWPTRKIRECAARQQAAVDTGEQVIVGVNKYEATNVEEPKVRSIDNAAVARQQLARLSAVRRDRDDGVLTAALDELRMASEAVQREIDAAASDGANIDESGPSRSDGAPNLLELAIKAAGARATVGEISAAMEAAFGRHVAQTAPRSESGRAAEALQAARDFQARTGRRPRILMAKLGQDGHDRGMHVVSAGMADMGWDVDVGPLFATPEAVARAALSYDVHVIGISTQAAAHRSLVPRLIQQLQDQGMDDVLVIVGGVIPPQDLPALYEAGAAAVFGPGTSVAEACLRVIKLLSEPQSGVRRASA